MHQHLGYLALCGFLISLDQISKLAILSYLRAGERVEIISGFFGLIQVFNPGAAFGFLENLPEHFRVPLFFFLPIAAVGFLSWIFFYGKNQLKIQRLAITIIIAGALGNFIDRLQHTRGVVDFFDFYIAKCRIDWDFSFIQVKSSCHWPAFNIADACISVGIILLIIANYLFSTLEKNRGH